jgi:hypothetical protein
MEIKGTAVRSIPDFIRREYPQHYQQWLDALPPGSKEIMDGYIFINNWYPLHEALIIPLKITSWLFYDNDILKTARMMGRYSAELSLANIYRYFIKLSTPSFIIDKTSKILNSYFKPTDISVVFACKNTICVQINHIEEIDEVIEYNVAGFMERALELSGCNILNIEITLSKNHNQKYTEYIIDWEKADLMHEAVIFKKILERG